MRKMTLRKSGRKIMTVQVKHYIGKDQLINSTAKAIELRDKEDDAKTTRAQVEKWLTTQLKDNAEPTWTLDDYIAEEYMGKVVERATAIINRLFPDADLTEAEKAHVEKSQRA